MIQISQEEKEKLFAIADYLLVFRKKRISAFPRHPHIGYQKLLGDLFLMSASRIAATFYHKNNENEDSPELSLPSFRKIKKVFEDDTSSAEFKRSPYYDYLQANLQKHKTQLLLLEKEFGKRATEIRGRNKQSKIKSTSKNPIIQKFENTNWHVYHRLEVSGGKLGQQTLKFGKFNRQGECRIELNHFDMDKWPPHRGIAIFNAHDRILILSTHMSKNKGKGHQYEGYAHYLFRFDGPLDELEVCLGHLSFKHKRQNEIVTKTGIMVLCGPNETDFTEKKFDFTDENISPGIRKYLSNLSKNEIRTPMKMITNLTELADL